MRKNCNHFRIYCTRELTKIHEEFIRAPLPSLIEKYKKQTPKGEFVVLMHAT